MKSIKSNKRCTKYNIKGGESNQCSHSIIRGNYSIKSAISDNSGRISSSLKSTLEYDHRSTIKYNKHNYSVYYTEVDDRPEASARVMFDDFEFQISRLSPYDDAEYAWCSGSQGKVKIYRNNKLIGTSFYMDSDDMGVENYEWCDEVIFQCIAMLEKYNHSIQPKIIHNSIKSKCKQKTIKASSNNMIKALNDQLYTKASQYLKNNLGWSLKDISDMLFIDISKIDANRYRIEVRAELDYDWMFDLVKTLDDIVQRYDKGAYFDMVEPGISEAYITTNTIKASTNIACTASIDLKTLNDDTIWDIVSNIDNIEDVSVLHAQHHAATVLIIFGNHGNTHRRISELKEAMNFFGLSVADYTTNGDNVITLNLISGDLNKSKSVSAATNTYNISAKPIVSAEPHQVYWYFTRHGVQPGSIPNRINNLYDIVDTANGSYFATDTVLTTNELYEYDIKEKSLPQSLKHKSVYASTNTFDYTLLSRLQSDCEYYLGNGNRNPKVLWAEDEEMQIAKMQELYNKLNPKPEWITLEDIDNYEYAMVYTAHHR